LLTQENLFVLLLRHQLEKIKSLAIEIFLSKIEAKELNKVGVMT
jgi:hypothetical protein